MMFWVPQSGDIGVGVSILSYDGAVQFGLITDKKLCKDPQAIIDRFAPEFENLVHAVLLMPWDERAEPAIAARALDATEALAQAADHLSHRAGAADEARSSEAMELPASSAASEPDGTVKRGRKRAAKVIQAKGAATDGNGIQGANGHAMPAGLRKRKSAFAAARGR
jgi:hypothetical protein